MILPSFITPSLLTWVIVPILIFLARIIDVSMGTVRVILTTRGHKVIAPLIGFFEILVWLLAIKQILANISNIATYLSYAGGFATGTYVGIYIEGKLSIGKVTLRVTTRKKAQDLIDALRKTRHFLTSNYADGPKGKVTLINMTMPRQDVHSVVEIIRKYDRNALYTIEDVRYANQPILDKRHHRPRKPLMHRKGK